MRLLNIYTKQLKDFSKIRDKPKYIVVSHRWYRDEEEPKFAEWEAGTCNLQSQGYQKIIGLCGYLVSNSSAFQCLEWLWIDTICIDKKSSQELTEAINCMFKWYKNAYCCVVYLCDVLSREDFGRSQWFTRGWTLQELLAPKTVIFLNSYFHLIGYKGWPLRCFTISYSLHQRISKITGVPEHVLVDYASISYCNVHEKMAWRANRVTDREEDIVYSVLGLFDVYMTLNYGEGRRRAEARLQNKINKSHAYAQTAWQGHAMPNKLDLGPSEPLQSAECSNVLDNATTMPQGTQLWMAPPSKPNAAVESSALALYPAMHYAQALKPVEGSFRARTPRFFQIGRVFSMRWVEPSASETPTATTVAEVKPFTRKSGDL